jgi:diaminopimelate decarboxylase
MMNHFAYQSGQLHCEQASLSSLAQRFGTPLYVYSSAMIADRYRAYHDALLSLPHTICYAVKANANLSILRLLARLGAGFDIVSGGELFRVLRAGGDPARIVFSGVGKTPEEMSFALDQGILSFNCESLPELEQLSRIAREHGQSPRVALRVNPDVDASTHPYISTGLTEHKFGIAIDEVEEIYERARDLGNLNLEGVSCHIGSQLLDTSPLLEAVDKMLALVQRLRERGFPITHFDFGGGLGVAYRESDTTPSIAQYAAALTRKLAGHDLHLLLEPGRSIVAEAGVLLTRVLYSKRNGSKNFVIVDAAMNDLIRPSLYQAYHPILPVQPAAGPLEPADVVGPVCETGDFFARQRPLPPLASGDLLAIGAAGAYGFVLSSQYNARPRAAELLIDGEQATVIRQRETLEDLVRGE